MVRWRKKDRKTRRHGDGETAKIGRVMREWHREKEERGIGNIKE